MASSASAILIMVDMRPSLRRSRSSIVRTGYSGTTTVATNNVPDGALEDNPDGSVNVYNEDGERLEQ